LLRVVVEKGAAVVLRRRGLDVMAARQGDGVARHLETGSMGSAWSIDREVCGIRRILRCYDAIDGRQMS
jgi:hypothetical protein